jgi:hypothetical protein
VVEKLPDVEDPIRRFHPEAIDRFFCCLKSRKEVGCKDWNVFARRLLKGIQA